MTEPALGSSIRGLNHLALVCSDMARTVDFYSNVLGFPLVKTVELPGGMGPALLLRHQQRRRTDAGVLLVPERPARASRV